MFAMRTDIRKRLHPLGLETTGAAAARKGITNRAVLGAVAAGRLPVYTAAAPNGKVTYLVRPEDADRLWSREPLPPLPDLVPA